MTTANWSAVVTNIPGTGSTVFVADNTTVNPGNRYYRVHLTSLSTPVDSDGDGLPDGWELQYFGNLTQTDTDDPDGDGFSNLQEFLAGTDPTDFGSALRITTIAADGTDVIISFTTCSNKFYELQFTDNLSTSHWTTIVTDISGTGGGVSVTDPGAVEFTNGFYRVKLRP
jgi:Bacterial TSP3 repeat